jgi:hypothetical protein
MSKAFGVKRKIVKRKSKVYFCALRFTHYKLGILMLTNYLKLTLRHNPLGETISLDAIAKKLYLATSTVKRHVNNIYAKLNATAERRQWRRGRN